MALAFSPSCPPLFPLAQAAASGRCVADDRDGDHPLRREGVPGRPVVSRARRRLARGALHALLDVHEARDVPGVRRGHTGRGRRERLAARLRGRLREVGQGARREASRHRGGNESPGFLGGILRLNQRIASRRHPGLAYEFRIIDGERHAGMQLEAYTRGLRFAFAPIAPESGPSTRP